MNKKLISPLISLLMTGGLLTVCLILSIGLSAAWFSSNREATAAGMTVKGQAGYKTEQYFMLDGVRIEDSDTNVFSSLRPSDTVTIQLYVKNNDTSDLSMTLIMGAPTSATDSAYIEDGKYHYFGSQLRISSITINGGTDCLSVSGAEAYLLSLDPSLYSADALPPTAVSGALDFSGYGNKTIAEGITVAQGGSVTLDISFEFVDNHEVQNAYIGFADPASESKSELVFTRQFLCDFSKVN